MRLFGVKWIAIVAVALLASCASVEKSQDAEAALPQNTELQIKLLTETTIPPSAGLRKRLVAGQNVQAMVSIPRAAQPDGRLLDPASVRVQWNGGEMDSYVFYKSPQVALIFAIVDEDAITTDSELSMTASLMGSNGMDAGWRLPVKFTDAEMNAIANRPQPSGRSVTVLDENKNAVPDAFVFGQRREDLYTRTDAKGTALLNSPSRSSVERHDAWKDGYWNGFFDPIRQPTVTILSKGENSVWRTIRPNVTTSDGVAVDGGLLLVDNNYFVAFGNGRKLKLELQAGKNDVLAIVPGYTPKAVEVPENGGELAIGLEPLTPRPPADSPK
ncbi:hypothetical protein BH09SUM1_BH09SUM1_17490 [soil metagenome]